MQRVKYLYHFELFSFDSFALPNAEHHSKYICIPFEMIPRHIFK